MQAAYPAFQHNTARDYGNRVGICRPLDAFGKHGWQAIFGMNSGIPHRYSALVADVVAAGQEVVEQFTEIKGTISLGMDEGGKVALIAISLNTRGRIIRNAPVRLAP